jgi:hypothetical protein
MAPVFKTSSISSHRSEQPVQVVICVSRPFLMLT